MQPTMAMIALKCPEIEVVVLDINEGARLRCRAPGTQTHSSCVSTLTRYLNSLVPVLPSLCAVRRSHCCLEQ